MPSFTPLSILPRPLLPKLITLAWVVVGEAVACGDEAGVVLNVGVLRQMMSLVLELASHFAKYILAGFIVVQTTTVLICLLFTYAPPRGNAP